MSTKSYPTGPLGGALRCGKDTYKGHRFAVCVWADESAAGMVIDGVVPDPVALAHVTLSLRSAAEH